MKMQAKHWASMVCVAAWSGLIGWGWTKAHPVPERIGGFTGPEMIAKATPACRLLAGGLNGAMEAVGSERQENAKPEALWSVDLQFGTEHNGPATIHTLWDGYTGELVYAARAGSTDKAGLHPVRTNKDAQAAAKDWLRSIGMLRTAAKWQVSSVQQLAKNDWKVVCTSDDRTVTARIDGRTGELVTATSSNVESVDESHMTE